MSIKYVTNRKGQQKRVEILYDLDGENAMTPLGPILKSEIHDKKSIEKTKEITTTNLQTLEEFEKGIYGRDNVAHHNRYSYTDRVINETKAKTLLDLGSGIGQLPEHLYRNRVKLDEYLGLEYSDKNIKKAIEKLSLKKTGKLPEWIHFEQFDLRQEYQFKRKYDLVTAFEIIEHLGVDYADTFMKNIYNAMYENSICLISTPVYSHRQGAFHEHVINGEVNEYTYNEMKDIINRNGFEIIDKFGTFVSVKDFKDLLTSDQRVLYDRLYEYYTTTELSWIFAPMFPEQSRNVIWKIKRKENER